MNTEKSCWRCSHNLTEHVENGRGPECLAMVMSWDGGDGAHPFPDECGCSGPSEAKQ